MIRYFAREKTHEVPIDFGYNYSLPKTKLQFFNLVNQINKLNIYCPILDRPFMSEMIGES
jgi:hypothetical protein